MFGTEKFDASTSNELILDYRPNSAIQQGKVIEVTIPPATRHYIDLARSRLSIAARITKSDEELEEGDEVGFANHPITSMFRAIEFYVQGYDFTREVNILQAYKSNIDFLLHKPTEYLESTAQAALFFKVRKNIYLTLKKLKVTVNAC